MKLVEMLKDFWKDEQGTASVEWILVAALVVIVAIVSWKALGTQVNVKVKEIANELANT